MATSKTKTLVATSLAASSVGLMLSGGCFSPNANAPDPSTSGAGTESTDPTSTTSEADSTETASSASTSVGESAGSGMTSDEGETSDGPTTGESTATDTAEPGTCGDGAVDDGEDCDEGRANGVGSACTESCTTNLCGDGLVAGEESCDDGEDNGTGAGDCAPDCSTTVETRVIRLNITQATNLPGDLGGASATTTLDDGCEESGLPGYRAMFADGVARRASVTPNAGDGQIDWVLQPWTRYVNSLGGIIWTTNEVALLGVEGGAAVPLLAPIDSSGGFGVGSTITGMSENWVTQGASMCNENSSSSPSNFRPTADPTATVNGGYLADNAGAVNCTVALKYYCVEQ